MSEIDELRDRVAELERRIEILFENTGAMDTEKILRTSPEPSPEVQDLMRRNKYSKAAKLYQEQSGADMAQTLAALKELKGLG